MATNLSIKKIIEKCRNTFNKSYTKIPVLNIPMMSDYEWHLSGLESRMKNMELYLQYEDVEEKIKKLTATVIELTTPELFNQNRKRLEFCGITQADIQADNA